MTTNGKPSDPMIVTGAPPWAIAQQSENRARFSHLEHEVSELASRTSALEQAVVRGASKSGAAAGRKWGSFAGAFIVALSTALAQCDASPSAQPPTSVSNHQ